MLAGIFNRSYQDTAVIAGYTYQYYVTAFSFDGSVSKPSNYVTVTAPAVVTPLTSFKVIPSGLDLECAWTHGQVPYADVVIEHKGPDDSAYSTLHRITDWRTNYCFRPTTSVRGRRHDFRIYRDNGISQSDALTDFIYPPYRNTKDVSRVYIKKIEYDKKIEGWLQGQAEFDIVATYLNTLTGAVQADSLFVQTKSGAALNGVLLKEWRCFDADKDWYSLISIHVIEQDPGDNTSVSLDVKSTVKSPDGLNTGTITSTYTHVMKDKDDYCGVRDLYYYDNPETVLQFPMFGVKLTLSENN